MLRHNWLLACFVVALTPQLAAAQTKSNIDQAAAARDAGDYRAAAALLEIEQRDRPRDPLVLRLLGSAYAYDGQYEKAIAVLQQARSIAPTDQDIALMLARTYLWAGRREEAAATTAAITLADPANQELQPLRTAIAKASIDEPETSRQLVTSVALAVSDVAVRGQNRSWHQTIVGLAVPMGSSATLSGAIDREDRSGPIDTRIDLRADIGLGNASYAYVAASLTPKADFREQWGVRAGGEMGVARTVSVTVDLRYADYGLTEIVAVEPGIRLHTAENHLSLSLKSINLWAGDDRHRSGWSSRGDVQVTNSVKLAAGGATYPDTEAGITRRTRAAFVGVVIDLAERVTLRTTYEYERRVQSYARNGIVLALSVRL